MEETKWLTKTKLIIIIIILLVIGFVVTFSIIRKNNLRKEYINFEKQLEYAAPNYLLKEKITLGEDEWREITATDILKQKLVVNKRSSDCEGYVIAQGHKNKNTVSTEEETKEEEKTTETTEEEKTEESTTESTKEETKKEEKVASDNITYKSYVTCKKIYTTEGYGTRPSSGTKNKEETQTENDTEKPKIELFGDKTITLKVGDEYKELNAMAVDNVDGDISNKIKITGKVDTTKAGTYTIKYTVSDAAKNKASVTRTVIVEEKEEEKVEEPKKEETTTNNDNNSNNNNNNNNSSNNNNNNQQTTPVTPTPQPTRDTTAPLITFNDNSLYQTICTGSSVNIASNGPYGFVARDNVDGNITSRVSITGDTGIISNPGVYNLYYSVSDSAGNTAQATKQFTAKSCASTIPPVTTSVPVSSVSITPNTKVMSVGSTYTLTVSISPGDATNKTLTYTSSNTSVATVDSNGVVKAVSTGSATIKATSNNGKVGVCRITVQ